MLKTHLAVRVPPELHTALQHAAAADGGGPPASPASGSP